jgi:predicted enzyme related to lactoylglutathione lyase
MCMVDHSIVHFEIPAKDVKKLMKFYVDLFGWKMQKVQWMDYWLVETVPVNEQGQPTRQGVNGGMYQKENGDIRPLNYINVESIDEYTKKIKALGGKIVVPKQEIPGTGWTAIAVDPEGNYFGLFQRK